MRERVFVRRGKKMTNLLLVAAHGASDNNTITLTKHAADLLDCHAVVNQGFEKNDVVDVDNDLADCNRIDHVKEPVIFDEFLKPIIDFRDKHLRRYHSLPNPPGPGDAMLIVHIHGVGNLVHKTANEQVAIIVGYGLGNSKNSFSCEIWRKNLFVDSYRSLCHVGEVYEGKGGGKYAGRDSNNLNQYFRKHQNDPLVDSLQLEFPFSVRNSEDGSKSTALILASALAKVMSFHKYDKLPYIKLI